MFALRITLTRLKYNVAQPLSCNIVESVSVPLWLAVSINAEDEPWLLITAVPE
jgi:hypothetical protein